ncbi:MAG: septum formation initiator family protein [Parafannyhessea sp.]|uniref:septum formation initiator family protein n=1 Tax=Parafannyhessea sp. TaxID=2847324 RepID=UPI003F0D0D06
MQTEDGSSQAGAGKAKVASGGRRARRGTPRTDGPLKHHTTNTKRMIEAQAPGPSRDRAGEKDVASSQQAAAAPRPAMNVCVSPAEGTGASAGASATPVAKPTPRRAATATPATAAAATPAAKPAPADHHEALAQSEAAYGVRRSATYDQVRDAREARAARASEHGTPRRATGTPRTEAGARPERAYAREARSSRPADGRAEGRAEDARRKAPSARERAAAGAESAREHAASARDFAARHKRLWVALAIVAALVAALYGPAQQYYTSMRRTQDLQTKYAALKSQNKDLSSDVKTLMTKSGIEDQARKNGYVYPGEKTVKVTGLKEDGKDPSAAITYKDDRTWYVKVLDVLFGYDRETVLK